MAEHIFLQQQQIEVADLHEVLDMSAVGQLEWGWDRESAAFGTNVDRTLGMDTVMARNLLEVRVGYEPRGRDWGKDEPLRYLRMKDAHGELYYVEDGSDETLLALATRVLKVGELALTTVNGRLSGTIEDCDTCERPTGHISAYQDVDRRHGVLFMGTTIPEGCVVGCDEPVEALALDAAEGVI